MKGTKKQTISCFKCSRLGVDCAAMRIPSKECFKPIKNKKIKGDNRGMDK